MFVLQAACRVSEIRSDMNKKRKQFLFRITWPADETSFEKEDGFEKDRIRKTDSRRKSISKKNNDAKDEKAQVISGSRIAAVAVGGVVVGALTSGVGLLAGMVVVGISAAAGGGAVAFQHAMTEKERSLTLACETYNDAEQWVHAIEAQIRELGDYILGLPFIPGRLKQTSKNSAPPQVRLEEINEWIRSSKWRVFDIVQGIRIFEQHTSLSSSETSDEIVQSNSVSCRRQTSSTNASGMTPYLDHPPCLRINIAMNGSPTDVFMTIMNLPPPCLTGVIKSLRVVESIDNHTDVIHIVLQPLFVHPTWTCTCCAVHTCKSNMSPIYWIFFKNENCNLILKCLFLLFSTSRLVFNSILDSFWRWQLCNMFRFHVPP